MVNPASLCFSPLIRIRESGFIGLQYQAWARGTLTVDGDKERTVVLYTDHVLEFWVDDEHHFGGDFYAYRKAPLVLHLQPGKHKIDVRIVRDVRAMGAVGEPTAVDGSLLLPDLVEGRLATSLGSISVRNEDKNWIEVIEEPQKITYLHPGGIVSHAILRPPSDKILHVIDPRSSLPVVIGLHGAGVETDSAQVRHSFDEAPNLRGWVLFPSGVMPWSGDDWHRWGIADIEAAVAAIPRWITAMEWHGPGVDTERWLVTGHSNGGQGTWYVLTHKPDKIVGAAPVSGYSSIQAYVPYHFWYEADPRITAILHSSLSDYRHELLLLNSCGITVHQQHGSLDDNVPPSHSRRLSLLLSEVGCPSEYTELPGKGHYFEGVMTTQNLLEFYNNILEGEAADHSVPSSFGFVVADPASMGAKGGLVVDQLLSSGLLGRVKAEFLASTRTWHLHTSNIRRIHFAPATIRNWLGTKIYINGFRIQLWEDVPVSSQWLILLNNGSCKVCCDRGWLRDQRHGHQLGGVHAILDTNGRFSISTPRKAFPLAVQISRNLFQYFGADAEITGPNQDDQPGEGNRISLLLGPTTDGSSQAGQFSPISLDKGRGLVVRDAYGRTTVYGFQEGLGAIFLRPSTADALELVIWGSELSALRHAARLVPTLTGIGQPDFIVFDKGCAWRGAAGVLALGIFDIFWNISEHSVVF
ncbi:MAG: hypothetical protein Q9188_001522 [Gyalolechia gomerana]